jgi:hypothetical protein
MRGHLLPSENFTEIGPQRDYFNRYRAPVRQARFEPSQSSKLQTMEEETQIIRKLASLAFSHEDNVRSLKSLVYRIPMESNNLEAPISSNVWLQSPSSTFHFEILKTFTS